MGDIDDEHNARSEDAEHSADDCATLLDGADGSEDEYEEWCILATRGEHTGFQLDLDDNVDRLV